MASKYPCVDVFPDYHDIDEEAYLINKHGRLKKPVRAIELGFVEPDYVGLFYQGRKPPVKEIAKQVKKCLVDVSCDVITDEMCLAVARGKSLYYDHLEHTYYIADDE